MAETTKPREINVSDVEHVGALVTGGLLLTIGLTKSGLSGLFFKGLGLAFIARGAQGYKPVYDKLGLEIANVPSGIGKFHERAESRIRVKRPASEIYRVWRNFSNLPVFMDSLVRVEELDDDTSEWTAKGPVGTVVKWRAKITKDIENEVIGWQSMEGSGVDSAGSVRFEDEGNGITSVRVVLKYDPPADYLGSVIAKWFGTDPQSQIDKDLRRFKEIMEAGAATPKPLPSPDNISKN